MLSKSHLMIAFTVRGVIAVATSRFQNGLPIGTQTTAARIIHVKDTRQVHALSKLEAPPHALFFFELKLRKEFAPPND